MFKVKKIRLSKRLSAVASFVERGDTVADIGSDHAFLPTYLVKEGIVKKAIAGEVAKGPFESALRNVEKEEVADVIQVRLADGLQAIEVVDDVTTVTIAGMGGSLITTILEEGKEKLNTVKRIVAQPNIHSLAIRQWAVQNEWKIIDETILKEEGKIYEVIVLEHGKERYDELDLLMGPILLKEKSIIFQEKWLQELTQWKLVRQALENADDTETTIKKKIQLDRQINEITEVLKL